MAPIIKSVFGGGGGGGGGDGVANLAYTASPTQGTITSDTGTDATIPAADGTNAGLFLPAEKTKLAGIAEGADGTFRSFSVAASDENTSLTLGTSKLTFRMPYAMTLTAVRASVKTAPTGSILIVDINQGGTSVLGTKLSIDATEKTSTTAASAATITTSALTDDAEITIDIDQIGATAAGTGLKVTLIGTAV